MNLKENIERIQEIMGDVIKEDNTLKIKKMINDVGLITTLKFFGGYDEIVKTYGDDIISRDMKISIIKELVGDIASEMDSFSVALVDIGYSPIIYSQNDNTIEQIEYFYPDFITIDVYGGYKYETDMGNFTVKYEDLNDNILDEVFQILVHEKL